MTAVCPNGHARTPENLYVWRGERYCRTCRWLSSRRRAQRRRGAPRPVWRYGPTLDRVLSVVHDLPGSTPPRLAARLGYRVRPDSLRRYLYELRARGAPIERVGGRWYPREAS